MAAGSTALLTLKHCCCPRTSQILVWQLLLDRPGEPAAAELLQGPEQHHWTTLSCGLHKANMQMY